MVYAIRYNSLATGKRIEYYKTFKTKKGAENKLKSFGWRYKGANPRVVKRR